MSGLSKEELIKSIEVMRDDFEYNASMINAFARIINLAKQLPDTPKKVVVPQYVADEIANLKKGNFQSLFELYTCNQMPNHEVNWFNEGRMYLPENERKLSEWYFANQKTFEQAWLYGYEVEQPKRYRVKYKEQEKNYWYFTEFNEDEVIIPNGISNKEMAYPFYDKRKAELVAELIGGEVEEV